MNLIDAVVTHILGEPYEEYGAWWVPVRYDSWGRESEQNLMFATQYDALQVAVGYNFLT